MGLGMDRINISKKKKKKEKRKKKNNNYVTNLNRPFDPGITDFHQIYVLYQTSEKFTLILQHAKHNAAENYPLFLRS